MLTDSQIDAELKDLEEFGATIEEDPDKQFDDVKKTAFMEEINSISGLTQPSGKKSVVEPMKVTFTPIRKQITEEMIQKESKYHTINYFFGDVLDNELAVYVPRLETALKKEPGNQELRDLLEVKKNGLLKFREKVGEMRKSGQMLDQGYLNALRKVLAANEKLHQDLIAEKTDEESITRVFERVEKLRAEIGRMDPASAPAPRNSLPQQPPEQTQQVLANKPPIFQPTEPKQPSAADSKYHSSGHPRSTEPGKTPSIKVPERPQTPQPQPQPVFVPVPTAPINQPPTTQPPSEPPKQPPSTDDRKASIAAPAPTDNQANSDQLLAYVCYKLECRKSLKRYFEENFKEKRADDIKDLANQMSKLETVRDSLLNHPGKLTVEKLDSFFPDFDEEFVIGEPRKQMQENAKKIAEIVSNEAKQIKNEQVATILKGVYRQFFGDLHKALGTPYTPMPAIQRQSIEVPCNDTNPRIRKGDLIIQLKKLTQTGEANTFRVLVEFEYDGRAFSFDFGYNNKNGVINKEAILSLDREKILKKFAKSSLSFAVYKKHLFGDKLVGKASVALLKLEKSLMVPFEFGLEWSGKKLSFSGELHVHKALDQPTKEMKVFAIEKQYPPWVPPKRVTGKGKEPDPAQGKPATVRPAPSDAPSDTPSAPPKNGDKPKPNPPPAQPAQPAQGAPVTTNFKSPYKFPLMSAETKRKLKALLAKNKMDESTAEYEMTSFCVAFLNQLEDEACKQSEAFAAEGDTESRKASSEIMMKAIRYRKDVEMRLNSNNMTPADYIKQLEMFVKLDENYLVNLGRLKHDQGVYFVSNRKALILEEIKMVKEQTG